MSPTQAQRDSQPFFEGRTGLGVKVAIIDSGVYADHPHLGGVAGGVAVREDGSLDKDFVDHLGHGTAVAAVIREKAPQAELFAVKVFFDSLSTRIEVLLEAIRWAARSDMNLINLSLGTSKEELAGVMEQAVRFARERGALMVAALQEADTPFWPGKLSGVVPVVLDWECPRNQYRVRRMESGDIHFAASGYPRNIPDVSPTRNLKGLSFAVANMSGFAARALEAHPGVGAQGLIDILSTGATAADTL